MFIEKFKSLPTVFVITKILKFLASFKETNFPLSVIKTFYFLKLKDGFNYKNGIIVKLPIDNYKNSLKNFLTINKKPNFKIRSI